MSREIIIKDTHRGLFYEDGVLKKVLGAGRYDVPSGALREFFRKPKVEILLVDVRQRELTIKGQEILTADKVAIRVSILVQFQVTNPEAAIHRVEGFEERIYSDVQLAARRSLASMNLETILTNRNQLSEDILRDVKESASSYGVTILRADVKDLVFPGNLQEVMNRVLTAERMSEAQLVEARTKAETFRIAAEAQAESERKAAEFESEKIKLFAASQAEALRLQAGAEALAAQERAKAAAVYAANPALLRLRELETLQALAQNANARLYIDFNKPFRHDEQSEE